jgi:oligopeptide transport system substrate-binding protein
MNRTVRNAFPYLASGLLLAALGWAISFGTLPPADFTFDNNTEIQTVDPAKATGQPEGRVIDGLFEGLLRSRPDAATLATAKTGEIVPLTPQPAAAESFTVSEDLKTYTFQMRPTAKWSDGSPVTADDFVFSWQRMLHPETASQYAYQLHYIQGTEAYNSGTVAEGNAVEVELADRLDRFQLYPRGTIVRGTLKQIIKPEAPAGMEKLPEKQRAKVEEDWKATWIYVVDVGSVEPSKKLTPAEAEKQSRELQGTISVAGNPKKLAPELKGTVLETLRVLPDFQATVGLKAPNPQTLVIQLNNPTPYFPELLAFYPLYPVQRKCVETHGVPRWTKSQNIVSNGPYRLQFRHIRDRMRLVKNEHYWDSERVSLKTIDILAIKKDTTALNMFLNGQIDWATNVPSPMIPAIREKLPDQFIAEPMLTVYFYRLNTKKPPLDNKLVRQALAYAVDRHQITEYVTKAGELPATSYVPPGMRGYTSPVGPSFQPDKAKQLLAEAGYPGGKGLPKLEILYNSQGSHQEIAEVIQQQWREVLGIQVELRNLEWGVYLDSVHRQDYVVARAGWIGDYPDPNTFLDMFLTDGPNNNTGWSHAEYDQLIRQAAEERDAENRLALLKQAETIFLDELPIIPFHFSVSKNLVRPGVKGFFRNIQDIHPLTFLQVDSPAAKQGAGR